MGVFIRVVVFAAVTGSLFMILSNWFKAHMLVHVENETTQMSHTRIKAHSSIDTYSISVEQRLYICPINRGVCVCGWVFIPQSFLILPSL